MIDRGGSPQRSRATQESPESMSIGVWERIKEKLRGERKPAKEDTGIAERRGHEDGPAKHPRITTGPRSERPSRARSNNVD